MSNIYSPICPVILAAGRGQRMENSELPKPLHTVGGQTIIDRLLNNLEDSVLKAKPLLVIGFQGQKIKQHLTDRADYAWQHKPKGTGHAVKCALDQLSSDFSHLLVLNGDHPFVSPMVINGLVNTHLQTKSPVTMATLTADSLTKEKELFSNYGRVIREAERVVRIVEVKDATPQEKAVQEVNVGYYCFALAWLKNRIKDLRQNNSQSEYYITDLIRLAVEDGFEVATFSVDTASGIGINTPEELQRAEQIFKKTNTT